MAFSKIVAADDVTYQLPPLVRDRIEANIRDAGTGEGDAVRDTIASYFPLSIANGGTGATTLGTWTSYTPTFYNMTLGNGTIAFKYAQIGKIVHVNGVITFGSTTTLSGGVFDWTLPVASALPSLHLVGQNIYYKTSLHFGVSIIISGNQTVRSITQIVSGSNVVNQEISATTPFTWASGSTFYFNGTYQAA